MNTRLTILALLASSALVSSRATDTTAAQRAWRRARRSTPGHHAGQRRQLHAGGRQPGGTELYRMADAQAVVLVTQANGDAAIRGLAAQLKTLNASLRRQGRRVPAAELQPEGQPARRSWPRRPRPASPCPILIDAQQLIGESLGVDPLGRSRS